MRTRRTRRTRETTREATSRRLSLPWKRMSRCHGCPGCGLREGPSPGDIQCHRHAVPPCVWLDGQR
eukprot:8194282-Prorocentrum_lima.AAC.1